MTTTEIAAPVVDAPTPDEPAPVGVARPAPVGNVGAGRHVRMLGQALRNMRVRLVHRPLGPREVDSPQHRRRADQAGRW